MSHPTSPAPGSARLRPPRAEAPPAALAPGHAAPAAAAGTSRGYGANGTGTDCYEVETEGVREGGQGPISRCPRKLRGELSRRQHGQRGGRGVVVLVLEVGDETDEWGPPDSERSCGTRLSGREIEQQGMGSFVFSQCASMLAS